MHDARRFFEQQKIMIINQRLKKGIGKCGVEGPKTDCFADVKKAAHKYLMRTDKAYREASKKASERNEALKKRRAGFEIADADQ
jgi:hypothetical protein